MVLISAAEIWKSGYLLELIMKRPCSSVKCKERIWGWQPLCPVSAFLEGHRKKKKTSEFPLALHVEGLEGCGKKNGMLYPEKSLWLHTIDVVIWKHSWPSERVPENWSLLHENRAYSMETTVSTEALAADTNRLIQNSAMNTTLLSSCVQS